MTDSRETRPVDPTKAPEDPDCDVDTSHLEGIEDGFGCVEVWEHLSDQRED